MAEATETEQKKLEPTSAIEEIGPCKVKLKIGISADKVKERIDGKYKELNESVALPGFRKGHAPRPLLERKFGKEILDNLKYELVSGSFDEVKEGKKLEPVGEPEIDLDKISVAEGKALEYEVVLEVRPNFELKEYTGIAVKKPKIEVSESETDEAIRGFQEARAELVPAEDATAKADDQAICDLEILTEGRSVKKEENAGFFLTEKLAFFGAMLPEFAKAFHGKKVGEVLEHPITIPEGYPDALLRGKPAQLKASIKSVKRKKLPAIDAEFCKEFDCDTVEELREFLRKRLVQEKEDEAREKMADLVVDEIVNRHEFAMPEGLVQSATEEALARAKVEMMMRGAKEEEIDKTIEAMRTESRGEMAKTLRAHFVLEQIAQKERIFVTEEQVEERLQQLATRQGVWPHELKAQLEQRNLLSPLRRQMKQELVREFLLTKAVVQEETGA